MRANSSTSGLVVVLAAMLAGCKPAEEPAATVLVSPGTAGPHEPPPESPLPTDPAKLEELLRSVEQFRSQRSAAQSQEAINEVRERPPPGAPSQAAVPLDALPSPPVQKLYFQCADDVTFAVRTHDGVLEVYPPGFPEHYVVLHHQPSEPRTYHYTAARADFRFDGELATFVLSRERWADCVSNPAAAVWLDAPRRGAR